MITITVLGRPAPQGSKRAFVIRGGPRKGQAAVIESSHDRVKSWRAAVIDAALDAGFDAPLTGPLDVTMTFALPRPKGHYRTGRNSDLLKPSAPAWPSGTPDLSKLCRATEDALTDSGIWADDALVVTCQLGKVYARPGKPPGAVITVRSWQ